MNCNPDKPREYALIALNMVNNEGKYANIALKDILRGSELSKRDRAFVGRLLYETLEKQYTIDWILEKFIKSKKMDPWIENILRLGCSQIMYFDSVPDSAACNESVNMVKKFSNKHLSGFVNGVLRNIVRNKNRITSPSEGEDTVKVLMIRYNYPEWLIKKWLQDYGLEKTTQIMDNSHYKNYTTIRINNIKTDIDTVKKKLSETGAEYTCGKYFNNSLHIKNMDDIEKDPLYLEGSYTVQGESSILVTKVLNPGEGDIVLDACSAPGGKSVYAAELMNMKGSIVSWDIYEHRINLIAKSMKRMGVDIIKPEMHDARILNNDYEGNFDCVLTDVPCSGWGVAYKKPDIKLKANMAGLQELINIQWDILTTCSKYVKPGGCLVYSTCTINVDENENMIKKFLRTFDNFALEDFSLLLPQKLYKAIIEPGMIQLIPGRDYIDGFFISKLRKKE